MKPNWTFYAGHTPPQVGEKFIVTKIERGILDLDSGSVVTCVTLEPEAEAPKPDWQSAPQWAQYWAVDPNGWAHWFEEEPVLALTINYCGWIPKTIEGVQIGMELWATEYDLALGIDWRQLKEKRND